MLSITINFPFSATGILRKFFTPMEEAASNISVQGETVKGFRLITSSTVFFQGFRIAILHFNEIPAVHIVMDIVTKIGKEG